MRDAGASAKDRVEGGVADVRLRIDPVPQGEPGDVRSGAEFDSAPTVTVDLPEGMSFNDFDPGEPMSASSEAESTRDAAPAVHFDPQIEGALDDDGIPMWEDPP